MSACIRVTFGTFRDVPFCYDQRLRTSFLYRPDYMDYGGQIDQGFYDLHASTPNPFLREDFLFCKRYIDDFNRCLHLSLSAAPYLARSKIPDGEENRLILDGIKKIRETCADRGLSPLLERTCIKGALHVYLRPSRFSQSQVSSHTFCALFELP